MIKVPSMSENVDWERKSFKERREEVKEFAAERSASSFSLKRTPTSSRYSSLTQVLRKGETSKAHRCKVSRFRVEPMLAMRGEALRFSLSVALSAVEPEKS